MPIIISMHSYRGGTGKSNLTANLAVRASSFSSTLSIPITK